MLLTIALVACSAPGPSPAAAARPESVPPDAVEIQLGAAGLYVAGEKIDDLTGLESDLVDGIHKPLHDALSGRATRAWIHADPDLPWMLVRKLVVTADAAAIETRWVGDHRAAWGPSVRPKATWRPTCDEPMAVEGVARRVVVDVFHGSDGTWVEAAVLFHPAIAGAATLGLPESCWAGARCDHLPAAREVCEAAVGSEVAPGRVSVAGPVGCLLPIRKAPGDEARWPDELAENLHGLGIGPDDEATLMIEANAPWSAAVAVLDGFSRAGLPAPGIGLPLVEGHGRPPLCTATVRDAATLNTAAARWLGSRLSAPP